MQAAHFTRWCKVRCALVCKGSLKQVLEASGTQEWDNPVSALSQKMAAARQAAEIEKQKEEFSRLLLAGLR
jgi:hypothetical protein